MKSRVSLTITPHILNEIDEMVDGIIVRSRSDAVEKILKEHITDRKTAVILAGGNPDKLIVKDLETYRPLVEIGGRKKLIEEIITKCRESGFVNIVIVGFPQIISKIYEILGNGNKYNVSIVYIEENKELGTAKSLELAKKYIKTDFMFLPCDTFIGFDLKKLYEFHKMHDGDITIGVHTRTSYEWKKGVVEMDGFRIVNYEENPKNPKTRLFGAFIGFMSPSVFDSIPPGDVFWSLQDHVFPKFANDGKLIGYPIAGDWVNVHTQDDVRKVIEIRKKQK